MFVFELTEKVFDNIGNLLRRFSRYVDFDLELVSDMEDIFGITNLAQSPRISQLRVVDSCVKFGISIPQVIYVIPAKEDPNSR